MVRTEKCNFWQAVASGISGVLGIGSGLIQSNQNKKMQREAMAHQTSEREASQEYQTATMHDQQAWQDQQRIASQQYQTSEREAQNQYSEDMYNKYQSPAALARQYTNAGLNPRLAASGTAAPGSSSGSSGGAPGASAPSASAPQGTTVAPPYQNISSWAQGFGDIAQAMKSLAEAKKTGLDVRLAEDTFDSQVALIRGESVLQQLNIDWTKVKTDKDLQEIENLKSVLSKTNAEVDEVKAATYKLVEDGKISRQAAETFMEDFENRQQNVKADTSNKEADTSLKDAQRRLHNLMAETEKEHPALYRSIVHLNNEMATLQSLENEIKETNSEQEKEALKEEYIERSASAIKKAYELSKDHNTQNGGIFGEISSGLRSAREIILGR